MVKLENVYNEDVAPEMAEKNLQEMTEQARLGVEAGRNLGPLKAVCQYPHRPLLVPLRVRVRGLLTEAHGPPILHSSFGPTIGETEEIPDQCLQEPLVRSRLCLKCPACLLLW